MKGKSHVKVFVRTRPTARPYEGLKKDGQSITVAFPKLDDSLINNQLVSLTLKFDGVLDNVSQDVVYETCVQEAVDSSLAGYNSTVFAYGQTGAGKTFTMSGDARNNYAHRGIIPRALQHVFRAADLRSDRIYKVAVSYLEIHNETLRDLLAEDPAASTESLAIVDDAATTLVRGLTKVPVSCEEDALRQFFLGEQARATAAHALNAASSRSHVLFTLHIEMRASAEADERALLSKLNLVDLAGSERIKKTQAAGGDASAETLRESSCINKSLTFLEQVVTALARGDAHVPFRQSKLTAALRDALGGSSNAVMIANLWPEAAHLEECASTLRFAARVRCLQTEATVNESGDPLLALCKAERQVRELRQELAMRDMLSGRGRVVYEDLSEGERAELQQLVLRFLAGSASLDELPIDSLKRVRETYKAFKAVSSSWSAAAAQGDPARVSNHSAAGQAGGVEPDAVGVGDVDATCSTGFCIGSAPLHARPPPTPPAPGINRSSSPALVGGSHMQQQQRPGSRQAPSRPATTNSLAACSADAAGSPDRNALFMRYKHSVPQGVRQAELVKQQQQLLVQLKQGVKDSGAEVNAAKAEIDSLAEAVVGKGQLAAGSSGGVLDDEHYQLLQQLKAAKNRYRGLFDGLRELRASCEATTDGLAAAKEGLLAGFDAWLAGQPQQLGAHAAGSLGWSSQAADQEGGCKAGDDDPEEDPSVLHERAELASRVAAAGDPGSAAFFAAAKRATAKALGARRTAV